MALSSKWFKYNDGDKESRRRLVYAQREVLDLLSKILKEEHDALLKQAQSPDRFIHAAWPYEQADLNGQMRALRTILEMTSLTEE
jgi:hypothetical protein